MVVLNELEGKSEKNINETKKYPLDNVSCYNSCLANKICHKIKETPQNAVNNKNIHNGHLITPKDNSTSTILKRTKIDKTPSFTMKTALYNTPNRYITQSPFSPSPNNNFSPLILQPFSPKLMDTLKLQRCHSPALTETGTSQSNTSSLSELSTLQTQSLMTGVRQTYEYFMDHALIKECLEAQTFIDDHTQTHHYNPSYSAFIAQYDEIMELLNGFNEVQNVQPEHFKLCYGKDIEQFRALVPSVVHANPDKEKEIVAKVTEVCAKWDFVLQWLEKHVYNVIPTTAHLTVVPYQPGIIKYQYYFESQTHIIQMCFDFGDKTVGEPDLDNDIKHVTNWLNEVERDVNFIMDNQNMDMLNKYYNIERYYRDKVFCYNRIVYSIITRCFQIAPHLHLIINDNHRLSSSSDKNNIENFYSPAAENIINDLTKQYELPPSASCDTSSFISNHIKAIKSNVDINVFDKSDDALVSNLLTAKENDTKKALLLKNALNHEDIYGNHITEIDNKCDNNIDIKESIALPNLIKCDDTNTPHPLCANEILLPRSDFVDKEVDINVNNQLDLTYRQDINPETSDIAESIINLSNNSETQTASPKSKTTNEISPSKTLTAANDSGNYENSAPTINVLSQAIDIDLRWQQICEFYLGIKELCGFTKQKLFHNDPDGPVKQSKPLYFEYNNSEISDEDIIPFRAFEYKKIEEIDSSPAYHSKSCSHLERLKFVAYVSQQQRNNLASNNSFPTIDDIITHYTTTSHNRKNQSNSVTDCTKATIHRRNKSLPCIILPTMSDISSSEQEYNLRARVSSPHRPQTIAGGNKCDSNECLSDIVTTTSTTITRHIYKTYTTNSKPSPPLNKNHQFTDNYYLAQQPFRYCPSSSYTSPLVPLEHYEYYKRQKYSSTPYDARLNDEFRRAFDSSNTPKRDYMRNISLGVSDKHPNYTMEIRPLHIPSYNSLTCRTGRNYITEPQFLEHSSMTRIEEHITEEALSTRQKPKMGGKNDVNVNEPYQQNTNFHYKSSFKRHLSRSDDCLHLSQPHKIGQHIHQPYGQVSRPTLASSKVSSPPKKILKHNNDNFHLDTYYCPAGPIRANTADIITPRSGKKSDIFNVSNNNNTKNSNRMMGLNQSHHIAPHNRGDYGKTSLVSQSTSHFITNHNDKWYDPSLLTTINGHHKSKSAAQMKHPFLSATHIQPQNQSNLNRKPLQTLSNFGLATNMITPKSNKVNNNSLKSVRNNAHSVTRKHRGSLDNDSFDVVDSHDYDNSLGNSISLSSSLEENDLGNQVTKYKKPVDTCLKNMQKSLDLNESHETLELDDKINLLTREDSGRLSQATSFWDPYLFPEYTNEEDWNELMNQRHNYYSTTASNRHDFQFRDETADELELNECLERCLESSLSNKLSKKHQVMFDNSQEDITYFGQEPLLPSNDGRIQFTSARDRLVKNFIYAFCDRIKNKTHSQKSSSNETDSGLISGDWDTDIEELKSLLIISKTDYKRAWQAFGKLSSNTIPVYTKLDDSFVSFGDEEEYLNPMTGESDGKDEKEVNDHISRKKGTYVNKARKQDMELLASICHTYIYFLETVKNNILTNQSGDDEYGNEENNAQQKHQITLDNNDNNINTETAGQKSTLPRPLISKLSRADKNLTYLLLDKWKQLQYKLTLLFDSLNLPFPEPERYDVIANFNLGSGSRSFINQNTSNILTNSLLLQKNQFKGGDDSVQKMLNRTKANFNKGDEFDVMVWRQNLIKELRSRLTNHHLNSSSKDMTENSIPSIMSKQQNRATIPLKRVDQFTNLWTPQNFRRYFLLSLITLGFLWLLIFYLNQPSCCDRKNNFLKSFHVILGYPYGPPPV